MPTNYNIGPTTYSWVELNGKPGATLIIGSGSHWANPINGILTSSNVLNFYGTNYNGDNQLYASFSGLLTFARGYFGANPNGDMIHNPWVNVSSTEVATAGICPLWNDYYSNNPPNTAIWVWMDTANNKLYVEWNQVFQLPSGSVPFTFQVIMKLNTGTTPGDIIFQYNQLDTSTAPQNMSVGVTTGGTDTVPASNYAVSSYNAANSLVGVGKAILFTWATPDVNQSLSDTVTITDVGNVLPDVIGTLIDTLTMLDTVSAVPGGLLVDTLTFTAFHAAVAETDVSLVDTVTFSDSFITPEVYRSLSDKILFGARMSLDSTDLASGRYRY